MDKKEIEKRIKNGSVKQLVLVPDVPEEVYYLKLMSGFDNAVLVKEIIPHLIPVLTAYWDNKVDHDNQQAKHDASLEQEDSLFVEEPKFNMLDIAITLSAELHKMDFKWILDQLLEGLMDHTGAPVDLSDDFYGPRTHLLYKVIVFAIQENLGSPLVQLLEEKGFSGMTTSLQQLGVTIMDGVLSK